MEKYYNLGSGEKNLLASIDESNKYDYDLNTYDFDLNKKNDSHIAIVNMIKKNSEVLDIGCATGLIGESLKKYKDCIVDGIEYEKEAFELAKSKKIYRNIYNISIVDNKDKILKKLNRKYDYIVLADVLEHLVEPWEALLNIYDLLKDDGKIILSVPNIANLDIIRALINDEFNYQYLGLLDTTHLRFFSKKSFVDMIKNIGNTYHLYYDVELHDSMLFTPPYHLNDCGIFSLFNIDDKKTNDFLVLQHIFVLTKSNKKRVSVKGLKKEEDYFEKINEYLKKMQSDNVNNQNIINDQKKVYKELEQNYNNLKDQYNKLEDGYNELEAKYNKVINSKGWKLLEKMRKIKNKF